MAKKSSESKQVLTYHTRLSDLNDVDEATLCANAKLYGQVERKLFAELEKNKTLNKKDLSKLTESELELDKIAKKLTNNNLKNNLSAQYGITSRQYNSISYGLKGKIESIKALRPGYIQDYETRITQAKKTVKKIEVYLNDLRFPEKAIKAGKKPKNLTQAQRIAAIDKTEYKLHYKKRRVGTLEDRLAVKVLELKNDKIGLCFGSNKLFNKQHSLVQSGYIDKAVWEKANDKEKKLLHKKGFKAWKIDWRASRSNQFFVMGSGDEVDGCLGCTATPELDGSLTLKVRLPKHLESTYGKYITIKGINFHQGQSAIINALKDCKMMPRNDGTERTAKSTGFKRVGTALSYRFTKDKKGWRVFVSMGVKPKPKSTSKLAGAIGVDINADHLAVTEINRHGNWIESTRFDANTYGASPGQVEAMFGDIAKEIASRALNSCKPVVIEKLDFADRKAELSRSDPRYARMLSSFAYGKAISMIKSACFKFGVEVIEVNPAHTSTIGAVNFAQRLGISTHQGAAMAIARRGLKFSERPIESRQSKQKNTPLGTSKEFKGKEQVTTIVAVKPVTEPTTTVKNRGGIKLKEVRSPISTQPKKEAFAPRKDGGHVTLILPVRNRVKHVWSQWGKVRSLLKTAHVVHIRSGGQKLCPVPLRLIDLSKGTNWVFTAKTRYVKRQENCSPGVVSSELPF